MNISQITIKNFKCFKGQFSLNLKKGLNILVGDNETGKSTILEAIHLALSGLLNGRYLKIELSQYLFNNDVRNEYLEKLKTTSESETIPLPPDILIEIFIENIEDDSFKALFEGNGNSTKQKACGIQFKVALNESHKAYYEELVKCGDVQSIPIEYYDFSWSSFARDERVTPKTIPIKSALIDSSSNRYNNGSDVYISRILKEHLDDPNKIKVEQAYRKMRDTFMNDPSIQNVNTIIKDAIKISDKKVELSVDLSSKNAWETTLTTYLDDVPFHYVGKGEQCIVKTKLALSHKKIQTVSLLLLEEPENHLSHTKLNQLIRDIQNSNSEKQVIISTHNSFVANKLGLENLILLNIDTSTNERKEMRLNELEEETKNYFAKLAGYDTLRLILCKKAILVEGDSDELVIQKAYRKAHDNKLPIQDQVDVISVRSLAFKRFLDIAKKLNQTAVVVTDNDGDFAKNITEKYEGYKDCSTIKICADSNNDLPTLEPQIVNANKDDLGVLKRILDLDEREYSDEQSIIDYMRNPNNKTACALKIFDTTEEIKFPQYILDAIS